MSSTAHRIFCLLGSCILSLLSADGQTSKDIPYASLSEAQKLDMYIPADSGVYPAVLWVHGGGWDRWDKALQSTDPQMILLSHGYALVSVNYRLSGEAKFPAQIQDLKAALRWVRAHAHEYRIDPGRVAVWGSSAGAHLAALLGTSDGIAELQDSSLGNPAFSTKVSAVIDWFGPIDFSTMDEDLARNGFPRTPEKGHNSPNSSESRLLGAAITERPDLVRKANPVTYITADASPFLIEHGLLDKSVPHQQSQMLYDRLAKFIGEEKLEIHFFNTGHGAVSPEDPFNSPENLEIVIRFLDRWMK